MIPRPQSHSKALGPGVTGPELLNPTSALLERPPVPTAQQPSCGGHSFMVDPHAVPGAAMAMDPTRQHTKHPYVTGTSVLAVKYRDGVLIAADTLGAYGSTKRYKSTQRVVKVSLHGADSDRMSPAGACACPRAHLGSMQPVRSALPTQLCAAWAGIATLFLMGLDGMTGTGNPG